MMWMVRGPSAAHARRGLTAIRLLTASAALVVPLVLVLVVPRPLLGQTTGSSGTERCTEIRYAFQPDCFEQPCKDKKKLADRLDLGPQIAVWVEAADRSGFVDTVMVTNLTARFGVGNRPGRWDLPSGPKHPYGKRLHVLPIWAWARGKLYPQVVMQDGREDWMGFHEHISSPDPYYCRPMGLDEVDVDAITCPTKVFNSAKGRFDDGLPAVPYPPRNDLMVFTPRDCDQAGATTQCSTSAERYAMVNDLDAVAAATPTFDRPHEGSWRVAAALQPEREYALMVEVNREFDQSPGHRYPSYEDRMLSQSGFTQTGLPNNIGQPSVVYRVPFQIPAGGDAVGPRFASTAVIAGYGSHDGANGQVRAPDSTIARSAGSGEGRLRTIQAPWPEAPRDPGKVFLRLDDCGPGGGNECDPLPAAPPPVREMLVVNPSATGATIQFRHPDGGGEVTGYQIRRHQGQEETDDQRFLEGVPVADVGPGAAGTMTSFDLRELKPLTEYVVAVRTVGRCGTQSNLTQVRFRTADLEFTQLTGCFVATAAYGSSLAPAVQTLRHLRNGARARSPVAAAAIDLYERSSPPLARALSASDPARALVRRVLAPLAAVAGAAATLGGP